MIILKTTSQLKSFMHRMRDTSLKDENFDWDDRYSFTYHHIILDGKKVVKIEHNVFGYGAYHDTHPKVIALYLPRGKSQGSQP